MKRANEVPLDKDGQCSEQPPLATERFFRDALGVGVNEFLLNIADREAYGPHPSAARLQAADLAAMADIDYVLGHVRFRGMDVEAIRNGRGETDGRTTTTGSRADAAYIYGLFRQGLSLRFIGVQRFLPRVAGFAAEFGAALAGKVNANIYLAPPKGQGLELHHDPTDVFVVQCSGRKTWRLYARDDDLEQPAASPQAARESPQREREGVPYRDVDMTPGDILYLPRGIRHRAAAPAGESLHVSFAIHTLTGVDLASRALHLVAQEADWLQVPVSRPMRVQAAVDDQLVAELAAALSSRNLNRSLQQYRRECTRYAGFGAGGDWFGAHRDAARLGAALADRVRRFGLGRR